MSSQNDRYYRTYVPMSETTDPATGRAGLEEMEVEVYYTLGGHNHWNGGNIQRGIWLSLWPVRREKTDFQNVKSVTRTVGDDRARRVLLQPQKRRQDAVGTQWAAFIKNNIDAIGAAAITENWEGVTHIVRHGLKDQAA